MSGGTLIVLAKSPEPGRCKTRLCPPCTREEAAWLGHAALSDTLDAACAAAPGRVVLALQGPVPADVPPDIDIVPQRGDDLAERIANAFTDVATPAMLIGMDTPQVSAPLLRRGMHALDRRGAALGLASDGGWWALGLSRDAHAALEGIPMSTSGTGAAQLQRLRALSIRPVMLPVVRDVDTMHDARIVVHSMLAQSRFATTLRTIESRLVTRVDPMTEAVAQ